MSPNYSIKYEGEIKFGPSYYRLTIGGKQIDKFVYGHTKAELDSGRYLAIEEWLTTDYQIGPITRVAIFDLENQLVTKLAKVKKGFVNGFLLKNNVFSYQKECLANQTSRKSQVNWADLSAWEQVHT